MKQEINEYGCVREVHDEIPVALNDRTFFMSRQVALQNIFASLRSFNYGHTELLDSLAKVQGELLTFIMKKQEETGIPDLDFDGAVYFVQGKHGEHCPSWRDSRTTENSNSKIQIAHNGKQGRQGNS